MVTPECHSAGRIPNAGQRNLGQKDKGLSADTQRLGHGLEVYFGLSRPCNPPKKGGPIGARPDGLAQDAGADGLVVGQVLAAVVGIELGIGCIARGGLFADGTLLDQPLDDRGSNPGHLGQLGKGKGQTAIVAQDGQHLFAGLCHPVRGFGAKPVDQPHRRRIAQPRRAGRKAQHRGHRCQGVVSGTAQKGPHLVPHGGGIQHPDDAADLGMVIVALARSPDNTQHLAWPKRHLDKGAKPAAPLGGLVIQQPVKRLGCQHAYKLTFVKEVRCHGHVCVIGVSASRLLR